MQNNNFSYNVRKEIFSSNKVDRKLLWKSFLFLNLKKTTKYYYFKLTNFSEEDTLKKEFRRIFKIKLASLKTTKLYTYFFFYEEDLSKLELEKKPVISNKVFAQAYLGAAFLARGWISNLNSKLVHLEIRVKTKEEIELFKMASKYFTHPFSFFKKTNYSIFYFKKGIYISDFLKFIFAFNMALQFEDKRIEKDFLNSYNKIKLIEGYNAKKIKASVDRQLSYLQVFKEKEKFNALEKKYQMLLTLRWKHTQLSLADLTYYYNIVNDTNYSKSTINAWLNKLIELTNKPK